MSEWTFLAVLVVFMFGGIALSEKHNHDCRMEAIKANKTTQEITEICK